MAGNQVMLKQIRATYGPAKEKCGGKTKQNIFDFSGLWKHAKCGPKQAREFFPANPNLADILREMDFDFKMCFGKET